MKAIADKQKGSSLEKKVSDLQKEVDSLAANISKYKQSQVADHSTLLRHEEKIIAMKARQDSFEPHITERFLSEAKDDALTVHSGYRRLILKQLVATEVGFLVRIHYPDLLWVISKTIIRAFDEHDAWWDKNADLTLNEWIEVLVEKAQDYRRKDDFRNDE